MIKINHTAPIGHVGSQTALTAYQTRCLRLAARPERFLMFAHERALARLVERGFVATDHVAHGGVWITPTEAGRCYLHRVTALKSEALT